MTPGHGMLHAWRDTWRREHTITHTVEYRAADRSNRWATTGLVLAVVTVAMSVTFFWIYGIPPLVLGAASLYYTRKAQVEGTARQGQTRAAIGLVALSIVVTVALLDANWHHLY
jgi:hypothetical protein